MEINSSIDQTKAEKEYLLISSAIYMKTQREDKKDMIRYIVNAWKLTVPLSLIQTLLSLIIAGFKKIQIRIRYLKD